MAGGEGANSRISDLMQGHQLTFGGIGISTSWRSAGESQQFGNSGGFQVYMDDENQPPAPAAETRRIKTHRPPAAAKFPVNDENVPPAGARLRPKTFGPATAAALADKENRQPAAPRAAAKTFAAASTAGGFQIYTDEESRPAARPAQKTCGVPAAAGGFQFEVCLDDDGSEPAGARLGGGATQPAAAEPRPSRAQQRKQKLKQRPLQEMQSSKRAALQPLPLSVAAARLPTALPVFEEPPRATVWPEAPAEAVHEALMRPAAAAASQDAPMASPESLHSSFDSICTLGPRRSRLDQLFSYEEYAADLYLIMRQVELEHRPRPDFMSRQPDITVTMRAILADWLVEVNEEYKLNAETLHLAVNYIDRFLSVMTVVRAKLQLVGTTALFIASKFEEIYPPTVNEFVYITDDTYSASQLKRMEHVMLKMLAFDMSAPTSNWFLNYYIDNGGAGDDTIKHLAQFLTELTLVQYEICNKYVCSVQAASALCLARFTVGYEPWTAHLERVSGLTREDLRPCVDHLLSVYQTARDLPQQAVIDKFSKDKFLAVANIEPPVAFCWN